jgi:hypothetical protein
MDRTAGTLMTRLLPAVAAAVLVLQPQAGPSPASAPVAISSAVSGTVWITTAGERRRLEALEWIPAEAVVEAEAGSAARLITIDGQRYEVREGGAARLSAGAVTTVRGVVVKGATLPRLPVAPIAGSVPGRSAAVRIRGERIAGMYPCQAVRTLAGATELRFEAPASVSRFEVEISRAGRRVLAQVTERSPLRVPGGVLEDGLEYVWNVRALGKGNPSEGEAGFATLDAATRAARADVLAALERDGEPGVMAAIDSRLGLLDEAVAALARAASREPSNAATQRALRAARERVKRACP